MAATSFKVSRRCGERGGGLRVVLGAIHVAELGDLPGEALVEPECCEGGAGHLAHGGSRGEAGLPGARLAVSGAFPSGLRRHHHPRLPGRRTAAARTKGLIAPRAVRAQPMPLGLAAPLWLPKRSVLRS